MLSTSSLTPSQVPYQNLFKERIQLGCAVGTITSFGLISIGFLGSLNVGIAGRLLGRTNSIKMVAFGCSTGTLLQVISTVSRFSARSENPISNTRLQTSGSISTSTIASQVHSSRVSQVNHTNVFLGDSRKDCTEIAEQLNEKLRVHPLQSEGSGANYFICFMKTPTVRVGNTLESIDSGPLARALKDCARPRALIVWIMHRHYESTLDSRFPVGIKSCWSEFKKRSDGSIPEEMVLEGCLLVDKEAPGLVGPFGSPESHAERIRALLQTCIDEEVNT